MRFRDRTVVVTAGANGIGTVMARRFREEGANVAIVDIAEANLDELMAVEGPGEVLAQIADVSDGPTVAETAERILDRFGNVDIFIANAGSSGSHPAPRIEDLTDEIWQYAVDVNLTSIIRYCRRFVPGMRERKFGRIVAISSGIRHGVHPIPPTIRSALAYATVKEAHAGMVRQFAKDLGPDGITANAISPGMILTGGASRVTAVMNANPDALKNILANIPVGRFGRGEDIAAMAAFLASEEAGFVSGEIIEVRGG